MEKRAVSGMYALCAKTAKYLEATEVGLFALCLMCSTLSFSIAPLLNNVHFPALSNVSPLLRDVSQFIAVVFFFLIALAERYRPKLINAKAISSASVIGTFIFAAIFIFGWSGSSPALMVIGSLFNRLFGSWSVLCLVALLTRLQNGKLILCLAIGMPLSQLFYSAVKTFSLTVQHVVFLFLPVCLILLSAKAVMPLFDAERNAESSYVKSITRPASRIPLISVFFATIFFFQFAFGFGLHFAEGHSYVPPLGSFMPYMVILAWVFFDRQMKHMDLFIKILGLTVISGFIMVLTQVPSLYTAASFILVCVAPCFKYFQWLIMIEVAKRNFPNFIGIACVILAIGSMSSLLGAAFGSYMSVPYAQIYGTDILVTTAIVVLMTAFLVLALGGYSFKRQIESIDETPLDPASAENTVGIDLPVEIKAFGLTQRESEVFSLLAKGRNGIYIADNLGISTNTVKAHVKHLYEKLDIHNHQELIDLVEAIADDRKSE